MRRGIFGGVVEQVEEHLLEQHGIDRDHRQVGGEAELDPVIRQDLARTLERGAQHVAQIIERDVRSDGT